MSEFQVIIIATISCFRNYTFAVHGEQVTLNSANGFQVKKIVPSGFELQNHITISKYRLSKYRRKRDNLNAADVKAKWAKRVNNSERPIQTYENVIIKKKGETVAKKRKQSVEAQMLEGFKRPCTNVPYEAEPTMSSEAGPSRQQITMMEVEEEGKGKAPMRTQTIPKPVVFRTPATEAEMLFLRLGATHL
ncbi:uncharacterized protein B0P05DRAFT_587478 [Gilbertella persicaria]|uniref:uncharacterized protein n=1 Tax=Gilbertella persicaria TaxID=101096 RepID=UPI00222095F0|nr:uncharacterized protein B0P05DRAFT_587478 [Gilbertella persicaria]KAI8078254.1 hypothetical protein B0P05DRAFT_587478 [Gilbertella persicaria]